MKRIVVVAATLALALSLAIPAATALAASPLPNGFTARIVATSGQTISGTVNATGYDLGIYIGPGVQGVTVTGATVTGANDEGILVQDARDIRITGSTVEDNAVASFGGSEVKGIGLAGSTGVWVGGNIVEDNQHGGIGVYDDGPNSPFAPVAIDRVPVASAGNVILDNLVQDNLNDCGVVVSAKNPGGGVADTTVTGNTVLGFDPAAGNDQPGVGGIVVAGGASGRVTVTNTLLLGNTVTGGFIPGISLHAFGPGVIAGTRIVGNTLSRNGTGDVSGQTTGVEIFAVPHVGTISGTALVFNRVVDDYYGVYHVGDTGTHVFGLATTGVTDPVVPPLP